MQPDIGAVSLRGRFPNLFGKLADVELDAVLSHASRVALAPGELLLEAGGEGGALYLVWDGLLRVGVGGRDHPLVAVPLPAGGICGDVSFIDRGPPTADVWAETPAVVVRIASEGFDSLAASNPKAARALLHALCEDLTARVRTTSSLLLAVDARPTRHARPDDRISPSREGWPSSAISSLFHR